MDFRCGENESDPKVEFLTKESIIILGRLDPTICQCLKLYDKGEISWEETLMTAVIQLVRDKANLIQYAKELIEARPEPIVIVKKSGCGEPDPKSTL